MAVSVTIYDHADTALHRFDGSSDAGLNKVVWDLTVLGEEGQEGFVSPGEYRAELIAGGSRLEGRVEVQDGSAR
jgi:hypothetical protein